MCVLCNVMSVPTSWYELSSMSLPPWLSLASACCVAVPVISCLTTMSPMGLFGLPTGLPTGPSSLSCSCLCLVVLVYTLQLSRSPRTAGEM